MTAPWLVPPRAQRYLQRMKLERLLFLMIAAGAVGTACGADLSSPSSSGVGGSGGGLETGTVGTTTAGQSGSATGSATGSDGSGSGGGGGAFPADCADMESCGNFGAGCIKCASKVASNDEYHACFDHAPCKAYALCLEQCGPKDLDCLQQCENQNPGGAAEYQALIPCEICGDCATLCDHAPDTCK
ncbi:MAG: hypothetical protein ABI134_14905 [Byssovorax sp.]